MINKFNIFVILTFCLLANCQTNHNETNTAITSIDSLQTKKLDTPIDELPVIVVKDASLVLPKHYKETTDSTDWVDIDENIEFLEQNCPLAYGEIRIVLVDIFDAVYQFPNGKKEIGKACELVILLPNNSKSLEVRIGIGSKFKIAKHRFKLLELYTGNNNYRNRPMEAKIQKLK